MELSNELIKKAKTYKVPTTKKKGVGKDQAELVVAHLMGDLEASQVAYATSKSVASAYSYIDKTTCRLVKRAIAEGRFDPKVLLPSNQ